MIASYGETSGFVPVADDEQMVVTGGDLTSEKIAQVLGLILNPKSK